MKALALFFLVVMLGQASIAFGSTNIVQRERAAAYAMISGVMSLAFSLFGRARE